MYVERSGEVGYEYVDIKSTFILRRIDGDATKTVNLGVRNWGFNRIYYVGYHAVV